jgi:hypothetical protein
MRIGVGLQPTGLTRGKLRAAGPIFESASVPVRSTAARHLGSSIRQSAKSQRERRMVLSVCSFRETLQPAGRKTTPSIVSPVVTKRQRATSSLRASATIIVFRVPARRSAVRAWYHRASALSF